MGTKTTETGYSARFDSFRALMPHRIRKILLVSTLYDAFVLEEDGPLGEKIWDQYVEMRLTMIPRLRRASSAGAALQIVESETIDLVLMMTRIPDMEPEDLASQIKEIRPSLPVILVMTDPAEQRDLPSPAHRGAIDKVFLWNNDPQLFLAIIKLVEDRLNVDHDTEVGGVGVILLVEDSVTYYSTFLPALYKSVVELTRNLMAQGLNSLHRQLRLRLRAKVLLAESHEEALDLFDRYRPHLLGVISDVKYWRNNVQDTTAGFELARHVRSEIEDLPLLLQSSESGGVRDVVHSLGAKFLDKNSPALLDDFRGFLAEYMGFGDFSFRLPDGMPLGRARTIDDLVSMLRTIPIESLLWHAERNHFSTWLTARAQVRIAQRLRPKKVDEFEEPEMLRESIVSIIEEVQSDARSDVVSLFSPVQLSHTDAFMHLGEGSMGGKGRGIAFLRYLLARTKFASRYPGIKIGVPQTVVVGTDEFSRFLDDNRLRRAALEARGLAELVHTFMQAELHPGLIEDLRAFVKAVRGPLAVRSSSLLEDSHLQPFAGLYATTMLPNNAEQVEMRLEQLSMAIKLVWLSTFSEDSKAYFKSTPHRLEDEQMAVLIQRVVGRKHGDYFYPTYSGVAQSFNFYPVSHMRAEDGIAELALGLGKTVVEGGSSLRFCPAYPDVLPQFPRPVDWLKASQTRFWALRLDKLSEKWFHNPDATLELCDLSLAEAHGELTQVASTYSPDDQIIRDGISRPGPRVITFSPLLRHEAFPFPRLLEDLLKTCQEAFGCPVEMEFAGNVEPGLRPSFSLLQVRPFISSGRRERVEIAAADINDAWCQTDTALGNGVWTDIRDILYVRPDAFDRSRTKAIAEEIGIFNRELESMGRKYILIGFGRWGSSDPWLGIGVTWSQISHVSVLIEAGLDDFQVDPSQGTHFFQNITSLGVGYLSVLGRSSGEKVNWDWLESRPVHERGEYVSHLRFDSPIEARIDGRSGRAVLLPPSFERIGQDVEPSFRFRTA